jgi:RNA polymerase sigma factor (TIGR02999 family)
MGGTTIVQRHGDATCRTAAAATRPERCRSPRPFAYLHRMPGHDGDASGAAARPVEQVEGDLVALDSLFPVVYDELRRIAHQRLRLEATGHTLSTTALVHEVYLRLSASHGVFIRDRAHVFSLAARAMRRVLVDCARRYRGAKRGAGHVPLALDDVVMPADARADTMVELDEALSRLSALEPRLAQIVECRFFAGLTEEETAEVVGTTARTVRRDWVKAKGWLYHELTT